MSLLMTYILTKSKCSRCFTCLALEEQDIGQKFVNIGKHYRFIHRKCDVRSFIHELQNFGKRMSERSERVSLTKFSTRE